LALGGIEGPILQLHPHPPLTDYSPQQQSLPAGDVDGTTIPWWRREQQRVVLRSRTIGRALDVDHPIADMLASRAHTRLDLLDDGSARIVDLNSVNGTSVDGVAASPSLPVAVGQRVGIGNTTLTFDGTQLLAPSVVLETVLSVDALTTTVTTKAGPKELLSNVSFALPRGTLMADSGRRALASQPCSAQSPALAPQRPARCGSTAWTCIATLARCGIASASYRKKTSCTRC